MEINSNNSSNNSKPSAQIAVNNQSFLIYVVDDQTINLDIIRVFLSNNDFQVITEIDIRKAIQEIKSVQPDLILLDVVMPEINGFEACRLLKSSAETKDIPIIFLTALDDAENQIKGIKLGAFDYITKPIKLSELLTRVNSCFHIVNLTRNLQQQSTILKAEIVAKQKAQFALEESEKTLKSIINNSPHGIIILNTQGKILFVNEQAEKLFGRPRTFLLETDLGIPLDVHKVIQLEIPKTSEELTTLEISCVPIIWNHNNAYLMTALDITERKTMEEKLNILFQALEQNPASIMIINTSKIIEYVNPKYQSISGYSQEEILGKKFALFEPEYVSEKKYKQLWQTIKTGKEWQGELKNKKKDGRLYWNKVIISPIFNEVGIITHYICVSEDITEQKKEEIHLHYQAKYDNLTKIPNRNYGLEKVNYLLQQAQETNSQLGLMFIDLDYFKEVNDTLGHDYGDKLLILATQRMKNTLRNTDLLVRLGGDEFLVAIPFVEEKSHLQTIGHKIIKALEKPFLLFQQPVSISASIGISMFPQHGKNLKRLIRNADLAMYQSKNDGRNQLHFYTPKMNKQEIDTLNIKQNFYHAILNDELKVVYQPVIELYYEKIVSTEALLRWESEELGFISPQEFIPFIEKNGMILDLEKWLLDTIVKDVETWQNITTIPVSINISEYQFKDHDLGERLSQFIASHDNFCHQLQIEVKEEMLLERKYLITKIMSEISSFNIGLCLDNFTGNFASLAQLNNLKIKCLKIDQSFIQQLDENPEIELLFKSIVSMAKVLNIKVVAKGIETQEQLEKVKSLQCDYGQGYFFGRPLSASNVISYLNH